jgi:hypothetical protein
VEAPAAVAQPSPQPASTTPAPAPTASKNAKAKQKPVLVAPTPSDPADIEKAREAMRQKMQQMPGGTTTARSAAPVPAGQPVAATSQPARVEPGDAAAAEQQIVDAHSRKQAEQAARTQASRRQKPPKPSSTPVPAFSPLEGPALPISADKQQRLSDLLQKYQTDQISPEQYHQQRAKILAEP